MALEDIVPRHFVAKIVFLGGSDPQGKKILEKTSFQQQKDSGAILLASKLSTVSCQALKHIPTAHKTPDNLLEIQFLSCVALSPAYCLDCSAYVVAIIPVYYITCATQPD